jgi:hypothetical protein
MRRTLLIGLVLAAAAVTAIAMGAGRGRRGVARVGRVAVGPPSRVTATARLTPGGRIAFSAVARIPGAGRNGVLWFEAKLRREFDQDSLAVIWERSWDEPVGWVSVKRGGVATMTLPETVIPLDLQPGAYSVWVEVKEDVAGMTLDGRVLEPSFTRAGHSTPLIEVPGP